MITNILKFWLGIAWLLGLAVAAALASIASVFVHAFILASKIGEYAFSKLFTSKSTLNTLPNGRIDNQTSKALQISRQTPRRATQHLR